MTIEIMLDRSHVLAEVQDASCRAIRWDAVPHALVFDLDCPIETKQAAEVRLSRIRRAWMIVEGARDLSIKVDWGEFRNGFAIVHVKAWDREDIDQLTRYDVQTDFPEGTISVSGTRLILLRSTEDATAEGVELSSDVRQRVASDDDFRKMVAALKPPSSLLT